MALRQPDDRVAAAHLGADELRNSSLARDQISLAVETGRQNGFGHGHAEIYPVEQNLKDGRDDTGGPRRPDDQDGAAVPTHNRRSHAGGSSFARLDAVRVTGVWIVVDHRVVV